MRSLAALCVLGFGGCSGNTPAPVLEASDQPAPAASSVIANVAPERAWVASGSAQATIPEAFQGRWDETAESCLEISIAELKVDDTSLTFWEVGVAVEAVTPMGANAIKVDGKGFEAEEQFDWSGIFELSTDGRMLSFYPGTDGIVRVRCLTPDFPGAEKH